MGALTRRSQTTLAPRLTVGLTVRGALWGDCDAFSYLLCFWKRQVSQAKSGKCLTSGAHVASIYRDVIAVLIACQCPFQGAYAAASATRLALCGMSSALDKPSATKLGDS